MGSALKEITSGVVVEQLGWPDVSAQHLHGLVPADFLHLSDAGGGGQEPLRRLWPL